MAKDTRTFTCPTCERGAVRIGDKCGLCGHFCTEARLQARELQRREDGER